MALLIVLATLDIVEIHADGLITDGLSDWMPVNPTNQELTTEYEIVRWHT